MKSMGQRVGDSGITELLIDDEVVTPDAFQEAVDGLEVDPEVKFLLSEIVRLTRFQEEIKAQQPMAYPPLDLFLQKKLQPST